MKGLILKDFYVTKPKIIFFSVFVVFYVWLTYLSFNTNYWAICAIALSSMLSGTSFAYDAEAKWDKYEGVLPISVNRRVASKYIFNLLYIALILSVVFITTILLDLYKDNLYINTNINIALVGCAFAVTISSLIITLTYKMGLEKARIVFIVILALTGALFGTMFSIDVQHSSFIRELLGLSMRTKSMLFLTFSLIFCFIMYNISVHIVNKNKSR